MMDRAALRNSQRLSLEKLLHTLPSNPFYRALLPRMDATSDSGFLDQFIQNVPLTTKEALTADCDAHPPFGSNLTFPLDRYSRFCQSSGTTSGPLPSLDTTESWNAMLDVWDLVYEHAGIDPGRSIFFAFSFGPFLGFWTAFESATRRGNLALPGGGLSSTARLQMMARYGATVLCCTPTYANRLGQILHEEVPELRDELRVQDILVAGEPGGSLPETRRLLSSLWNGARIWDHHGMTEVGPVSFESSRHPGGLIVAEEFFLAEILDPENLEEVEEGETGELVLTTLRRAAKPLLRYRTGDLVRKCFQDDRLFLPGGILGRIDDMIVIRGVNLYPSAIERVLRAFPEIGEYRVIESLRNAMAELLIQIETSPGAAPPDDLVQRVEARLRDEFALRIPVQTVQEGTLPRFEFKSKRWIKSHD